MTDMIQLAQPSMAESLDGINDPVRREDFASRIPAQRRQVDEMTANASEPVVIFCAYPWYGRIPVVSPPHAPLVAKQEPTVMPLANLHPTQLRNLREAPHVSVRVVFPDLAQRHADHESVRSVIEERARIQTAVDEMSARISELSETLPTLQAKVEEATKAVASGAGSMADVQAAKSAVEAAELQIAGAEKLRASHRGEMRACATEMALALVEATSDAKDNDARVMKTQAGVRKALAALRKAMEAHVATRSTHVEATLEVHAALDLANDCGAMEVSALPALPEMWGSEKYIDLMEIAVLRGMNMGLPETAPGWNLDALWNEFDHAASLYDHITSRHGG